MGHTQGGDRLTERTFTRKDIHRRDILMEGHIHEEIYTQRRYIGRGHSHGGRYAQRDMLMERPTDGERYTRSRHTHGGDIHMKGHTHGTIYKWKNIPSQMTYT